MTLKCGVTCAKRQSSILGLWLVLAILLTNLLPLEAFSEQIDLHVWGLNMGEPRYGWYALIEAFERKHPGVRIVIGPTERSTDLQKLLCGIAGASPPDVFRRESSLFGAIAARDILMPLDSFIEEDKHKTDGLHKEDYLPGAWESGKWEGKVYAIVEDSNPAVLAYNKRLFREAGLDPEHPPSTWAEWLNFSVRLTQRDENDRITRLGTLSQGDRDDLGFYITQCGGNVFSEDGRICTLNTPEAMRALEFIKSLHEAQGGREAFNQFLVSNSGPEQFAPFTQNKIAMSVEDDWVLFRVMRYGSDMELGIAPIPTPDGKQAISVSTTNTMYMIPHNARHPNEAWAFIRFLNSPEGQLAYADAVSAYGRSRGQQDSYTGFRPSRKAQAALTEHYAPREPQFLKPYNEISMVLESLVSVPVNPVSGILRDEMKRIVDRVTYGEATVSEALKDGEARVQEELDLFYVKDILPEFRWSIAWACLSLVLILGLFFYMWQTRDSKARSVIQRSENRYGLLFVSPWLLGMILFTAGPMVFSFAISFCDYDVLHPARFLGLRNYVRLFTRDPLVWKSLGNTTYMVLSVPLGMAVGLSIALLLNAKVRGMSVYRTIFYLPAVTPTVATAVLWYALLNPDGLINAGLNASFGWLLGIRAPSWLEDPAWAKPAIILMGLWGAGSGMIFWLAGLQGVPQQLYEAASIDGAGVWRRFRHITLPLLTPYTFFSLIVGIIGAFQIFSQSVVLTQGGPSDSTLFYVYYLFNNAFRYFRMGYASAQAWVLFVIVLILTLIQLKISRRWVHYG